MSERGTVNIRGKDYETVASRVQRFRQEHGSDYAIATEIVSRMDDVVVMKANIVKIGGHAKDKDGQFTEQIIIATGYAEERRDSSSINRTSALENCETSAIGRALANFGMAGTEYASADEVANAIGQQSATKPKPPQKPQVEPTTAEPATATQKARITALLRGMGVLDEDMKGILIEEYGVDTNTMTKVDAEHVIEAIQS